MSEQEILNWIQSERGRLIAMLPPECESQVYFCADGGNHGPPEFFVMLSIGGASGTAATVDGAFQLAMEKAKTSIAVKKELAEFEAWKRERNGAIEIEENESDDDAGDLHAVHNRPDRFEEC